MNTRAIGRMHCGCTVEATVIEGKPVYSVQQCPLHKAAPDLLRALEDIAVLLTGHTATPFLFRLDQIAQTAIVKAKP